MQITATIKVVNDKQSGISRTSGNEWKRQQIILGWEEQAESVSYRREQLLMVTLYGKGVDRFEELELGVGDTITGNIEFGTRNVSGHIYNDVTLFLN